MYECSSAAEERVAYIAPCWVARVVQGLEGALEEGEWGGAHAAGAAEV